MSKRMHNHYVHRLKIVLSLLAAVCLLGSHAAGQQLTPQESAAVEATKPKQFRSLGAREPLVIPDVASDEVICFCPYTTHDGILKLSAQLYPLKAGQSRAVTLELTGDGVNKRTITQEVDRQHWMTTFRVEDWDDTRSARYRVTHPGGAVYEGTVRKNPVEKQSISVAAFSCNGNSDRGPREDIIRNVRAQDPDLLFFAGDQSYDHKRHLAAWLLFGRQFGEIIRDRPTVTIPDDHDVGQPNLWGAGGKVAKAKGADDGGYLMPAEYVNMVQRAQTAHLPDPYDPAPIDQDITVYYTSLNVGGVDFAIIEDRKWKTGPAGLVPQQGPRPDHVNDPDYDPQSLDQPEATLLGQRQLDFLDEWAQDWDDTQMKCVLSQTIFTGGAHLHGGRAERLVADLDSNGWPQSGRNRALRAMRKAFAIHIAGDQHLATVSHYGINEWDDAGWAFCVPSIVNYYGRWWWPQQPAADHNPACPLPYTGRFYDGFDNKLNMWAYANPTRENQNAAGYGLIKFNKQTRKIRMECWPRDVDVTKPDAKQFLGWPITVTQESNYARPPRGYLPTIEVSNATEPVVQVIDQSNLEVLYTLRIRGESFDAPIFNAEHRYTLIAEHNGQRIKRADLKPTAKAREAKLEIEF